jgi:2-polyprenyl-3-methyl-5-hydroxy-6-metoxy-1,4-benzoquinol methylase
VDKAFGGVGEMTDKPRMVVDENLRFVASDPTEVLNYIEFLKSELNGLTDFSSRVSHLGEIGVYLRVVDQFEEAEKYLVEALQLINSNELGILKEVQQKIRLAHVWQDKKEFVKSDALFNELIQTCRENKEAHHYLDFALQHTGKSSFDQGYYHSALSYFSEALEIRLRKNSPNDQIESTQKAIQVTQERMILMDQKTQIAYSENASSYSQDWLSQPAPTDMYEILKRYFVSGGDTADIGCGNGRDSNWLSEQGFSVTGYDSSPELVKIASHLYPKIQFRHALLPSLKEINNQFDNVICETVIMHLSKDQILEAIQNLKRILKDNGVLYLSWRVTEFEDVRHDDGRLYSAFNSDFILNQFPKDGILHFEDKLSVSSGKRICRLVYKKDTV